MMRFIHTWTGLVIQRGEPVIQAVTLGNLKAIAPRERSTTQKGQVLYNSFI
jgi:hypothetical protein